MSILPAGIECRYVTEMMTSQFSLVIGSCLSALAMNGCGPRDYYTQTQTGPHGQVTMHKAYYTPEQLAARNEAFGITTRPTDAKLSEIAAIWPKLNEDQRAKILEQVRQISEIK